MENIKIKVGVVPSQFLKLDETKGNPEGKLIVDQEKFLLFSGHAAGVCYDKEGFEHVCLEPTEKTEERIGRSLSAGHHSVCDHSFETFNMQKVPKILAMVLNNEKEYTTSEKSARYTPVVKNEKITGEEQTLYDKWIEILKVKIKAYYDSIGKSYTDNDVQKKAQENARYFVTVFMPTEMVYTTSVRQINYIAAMMEKYIAVAENSNKDFDKKLANSMKEFIQELKGVDVLEDRLMRNEKDRSLSIFGEDIKGTYDEHFGKAYSTTYEGSFAQYAQAHRHRTIDYQLEMNDNPNYYVPPIIRDDAALVEEWLEDMKKVAHVNPQGEMVTIGETGTYENFILKCKERLCQAAQLEIAQQTEKTLYNYKAGLEASNHPFASDIVNYTHGARCTFSDFTCTSPCQYKEGIQLTRKI